MTFNLPLIATTCGEILLTIFFIFSLVPLAGLFAKDPDILMNLIERMGR